MASRPSENDVAVDDNGLINGTPPLTRYELPTESTGIGNQRHRARPDRPAPLITRTPVGAEIFLPPPESASDRATENPLAETSRATVQFKAKTSVKLLLNSVPGPTIAEGTEELLR